MHSCHEWTNIDLFLCQDGFCIVENVLFSDRCKELKNMFETYLREASSVLQTPLGVDNPDTWNSYKEFFPSNGMMLKHFFLCDSEFMWSVRQDPAIIDLWAYLYDTAPICSFLLIELVGILCPKKIHCKNVLHPKVIFSIISMIMLSTRKMK